MSRLGVPVSRGATTIVQAAVGMVCLMNAAVAQERNPAPHQGIHSETEATSTIETTVETLPDTNGCAPLSDDCTTVELLVPQDYKRLTSTGLGALLTGLPGRIVQFPTGSTLQGLVAGSFKSAPGQPKAPYEFQDRVLSWMRIANGITDDKSVKVGKLLMPVLPSMKTLGRLSSQATGLLGTAPSLIRDEATGLLGLSGDPLLQRRGSISVVRLHIPRTEAARIVSDRTLGNFLPTLVDEEGRSNTSVEFTLAGQDTLPSPGGLDLGFLTEKQMHALRERLARPVVTPTRVVVIDSGWPDVVARDNAWSRLATLSDTLDDLAGIRIVVPPRPTSAFVTPTNPHAANIAATIHALESLGPDPQIPVVAVDYVPLTKEQGAGPWLRAMLALGAVARDYLSRKGQPNSLSQAATEKLVSAAWREADLTLAQVPSAFGEFGAVRSSSAIIDRMILLTHLMAEEVTGEHYFVNTSWTAPKDSLAVSIPRAGGVIVAALGNYNIVAAEGQGSLDFARLSYGDPQIVAVANYSPNAQAICNTSMIDPDKLRDSMMVKFDGALGRAAAKPGRPENGAVCGTSFAAPRVAWILAAVEARRTKYTSRSWIYDFRDALHSARLPDNSPGSGWLDVTALLAVRP
jgi:hypothetical protein